MERVDWNDLFMSMAFVAAQRSPDPNTKHGAILVDDKNRIVGMGFNGFPRGCQDQLFPTTRPEKYYGIIHAEPNCLFNAASGTNFSQCTLYVTGKPCIECLKVIVQHGVKRVIYGRILSKVSSDTMESRDTVYELIVAQTGTKLIPFTYNPDDSRIEDLLSKTLEYVTYTKKGENIK